MIGEHWRVIVEGQGDEDGEGLTDLMYCCQVMFAASRAKEHVRLFLGDPDSRSRDNEPIERAERVSPCSLSRTNAFGRCQPSFG